MPPSHEDQAGKEGVESDPFFTHRQTDVGLGINGNPEHGIAKFDGVAVLKHGP